MKDYYEKEEGDGLRNTILKKIFKLEALFRVTDPEKSKEDFIESSKRQHWPHHIEEEEKADPYHDFKLKYRYPTPLFNIPVTDLFASLSMAHENGPCCDLELKALECIEYYGAKRGQPICKEYYDDYMECLLGRKQREFNFAIMNMRNKRRNEYYLGKREWKSVYERLPEPIILRDPSMQREGHYVD